MRKRSIGKLISLALSATLAFTSVIPAHAADFYPDEDGGEIVVESDEDFMAEEDSGAEEALGDVSVFDAEEAEEVVDDSEEAELMYTDDMRINFLTSAKVTLSDNSPTNYDPAKENKAAMLWASDKDYVFVAETATGYEFDYTKSYIRIGWVKKTDAVVDLDDYDELTDEWNDTAAEGSGAYSVNKVSNEKAIITISANYFKRFITEKGDDDNSKVKFIIQAIDSNVKAKTINLAVDSSYPASIPASKLALKYDQTATFDMSGAGYEIAGRPITGVIVYIGTGKEETPTVLPQSWTDTKGNDNPSDDVVHDYYTWTPDTKALEFTEEGVNMGLVKGLTVKFIDANYTLSQTNAETDKQIVFHEGKAAQDGAGAIITLVPQNPDLQNTNGVTANLVTTVEGRKLASIDIVATNPKTGEVTLAKKNIPVVGEVAYAIIPKDDLKGNLAVTANTVETITCVNGGDAYTATLPATAATGKDYTFSVVAKTGLSLTATAPVQYIQTINGSDVTKTATDNHDGTFTIPGTDVVRQTTIKVNTASETSSLKAVIASLADQTDKIDDVTDNTYGHASIDNFVVKDVKYGLNLKTSQIVKKDGEAFYFTVNPADVLTHKVTSVGYKITADQETATPATVVDTARGLYSIPATVTGPVFIEIDGVSLVGITVSNNAKAAISIGGEVKKSTDTKITAQKYQPFTFTIAGADSSIKITKVGYKFGGGAYVEANYVAAGTENSEDKAGTYTIAAADMTVPVAIYAQTLETATNGGGKYFVDFVTYAPLSNKTGNVGWDYAYKTNTFTKIDDPKDLTHYKRNSDTLRVAQNSEITLRPVIKKVDGTVAGASLSSPLDADKCTVSTGSGKSTYIKLSTNATFDGKFTAVKQGTDTIEYTLTQAAYDSSTNNENLVQIIGSQTVKVEPKFVAYIAKPGQEFVDSNALTLGAVVRNGATDAIIASSADAATLSNDLTSSGGNASVTFEWTPNTGKVKAVPTEVTELSGNALYADVATSNYTKDDPTEGVTFNFTITDTDKEVYTATNAPTLYPVVDTNYMLVPTVTVAGGGEYFKGNTAVLGVEDLKSATITYQLYEIPTDKSIDDYADQDELDAALELDKIAVNEWARKVDATYSYELYNENYPAYTDKNDTSFVNGSGSANVYTVSAVKKSSADAILCGYATVGHVKIAAPPVTITVNQNQKLVPVDLLLNDVSQVNSKNEVVSHKLTSSTYENIWKSENAPAKPFDLAEYKVSNGYQLKVPAGTKIKLPEESDFASALFTDKTRTLTGWSVTCAAGNQVEGLGDTSAHYYKPGESIVVKAGTSASHAVIAPIWTYRYAVTTVDNDTNKLGFYVDNGAETTYTVENEDGTETEYTVPDTSAQLSGSLSVKVNGNGKQIGAVVKVAQKTADALANVDYTYLFPKTTAGTGISAGKVEWFAFDVATASSGVTMDKIKGITAWASDAEKTAASTNTALDKTKLAEGKLLGLKNTASEEHATSAKIYAKYTAPDGTVVYSDGFATVTIDQEEVAYTLDITGLPSEIEVGQSIGTDLNTVKIYKNTAEFAGTNNDRFTWNITPSAGLTIEASTQDTVIKGNRAPVVTGKTASTTKVQVTLTYTDPDGVSVTSAAKEIEVKAASYSLVLVDEKGHAIANPVIEANVGGTSTFYIQVKDKNGDPTAVAATAAGWESSAPAIIGTSETEHNSLATAATTSALIHVGTVSEQGTSTADDAAISTLGNCDLTAKVTISGKVYSLKIPAKTYYEVRFDASEATLTTGTVATATQATQIATDKYTTLYKSGTAFDAETDIVEKYYKEDLDSKGKFTMDLTPYTAKYTGEGNEFITFAGWGDSAVSSGKMGDTSESAVKKLDRIEPANVTLIPNFTDTPVNTITTNKDTIVLDNQKFAEHYKENVVISTTAIKSLDQISFAADENYAFVAADKKGATKFTDDTTFDGRAFTASTTAKTAMTTEELEDKDTARTYIFAVAPEANNVAGKAKFTITSQNSDVKKVITVIVKGPYTDNGKARYMLETGEYAKDTSVTYKNTTGDEVTKFYDKDGVEVTTGIVKSEDGKFYVLKGGEIQKGYIQNADGKGNATYADPTTGVITPNAVAKINGVNTYFVGEDGLIVVPTIASGSKYGLVGTVPAIYLADEAGKILTESAFAALGVESIVIGDVEYVVGTDDIASQADVRYAPTVKFSEWPENWNKTSAYPTITYTVTYTSAKQGKTVEDKNTYKAVVTAEPTTFDVNTRKVVFTATTNLKGFYADRDGKTAASDVTTTKAYMFFNESSESEQVIEISDDETGIVITGLADEYDYTGNAIMPKFSVVDAGGEHDGIYTLAKGVDYTVKFKNNKNIGVAEVTITGKGNYSGQSQTANFKIVDPFEDVQDDDAILKGANVKVSKDTLYYNGEAQYPSYIEIKLKGESSFKKYELTDGQNSEVPAVITYSNNVNKGTATICLTGKKDDKGKVTTIKKTFAIKAVDMKANASKFTVAVDEKTPWAVKGATPSVSVTYNETGEVLLAGEDFTVKYNNNKKVGTAATVSITGKNNFAGTIKDAKAFEIEKFDLADADLQGATVYDGVKGGAVKVTLGDAKKDFIAGGKLKVTVLKGETDMAKTKLVAGDEVTVKVEPKANSAELTGSIEKTFTVGANLAKATIKITTKNYSKQYTGEAITLDEEDMKNFSATIKIGKETKTLVYGEDFVIGGYNNNIKKGTMQVTFIGTEQADEERGIPAISGAKTVKVKISAKPMQKAR